MKILKSLDFMKHTEFLIDSNDELVTRIHTASHSIQLESKCITLMDWYTGYVTEYDVTLENMMEILELMDYCFTITSNDDGYCISSLTSNDKILFNPEEGEIILHAECGPLTILVEDGVLSFYPNQDGVYLSSEPEVVVNPLDMTGDMQQMLTVALDSWLTK